MDYRRRDPTHRDRFPAAALPSEGPSDSAAKNRAKQTRDSNRIEADREHRCAGALSTPAAYNEKDKQPSSRRHSIPEIRSHNDAESSRQTVHIDSQSETA